MLFAIFIFFLIFLFRLVSCFSKSGFLFKLLYILLFVSFSLFFYFFRICFAEHFFTYLTTGLVICSVSSGGVIIYKAPSPGGQVEIFEIPESPSNHVPSSPGPSQPVPPLPAPSGPPSGKEDSFDIGVLLESWSKKTDGTSVNQPEDGPVPPGNPVASGGEEAGRQTLRAVPYPYQPDEVIGGDCVLSIQRRLLAKHSFPPSGVIEMARIQAEDLFEGKVEIIKLMADLDPTGDWMGRGARALDNSRTATGEESLEGLYSLLEDRKRGGVQSATYSKLKGKVFLRMDPDEHSAA